MRLDKVKYPPEPQCNDDLMPEDLPDALEAWEHECDGITIANLQSALDTAKGLLKIAKCPDAGCENGVVCDGQISEDEWQYHQCQWCCEKEQALESETNERAEK